MRIINMMLLGVFLIITGASFVSSKSVWSSIQKYELKEFNAAFRHFKIGDIVPNIYRTEEYKIIQWQQRNLPAPSIGSHWTYLVGTYVLISDAEGKVLKAYDGKIFYYR